MSALLRSARFLRLSPLGALQITAAHRFGPLLHRLYSVVLGGCGTGARSLQSSLASGIVCSPYVPRSSSCRQCLLPLHSRAMCSVRTYSAVAELDSEVSGKAGGDASVAVRLQQVQQFEWDLSKLDTSVRRTGRITKTLLLRIFHDVCRAGYPSSNHALLMLRSCGSLLPEVSLEKRNELAHHIWDKLEQLGVQYDVSHYNALLKVYLQNDFKFPPTEFLAKMEAAGIVPNRVTYQRLIAAYCQSGDIDGASTILGFMKSKGLPITEAVFSSLITGHARTGDMESAMEMLSVMRGAGVEPGPDSYVSLLNIYAEKGDLENLKKIMKEAESADCSLTDKEIIQVVYTLAKAGHPQHIPELLQRLKRERHYIPEAMSTSLNLVTQGLEDTAFEILKTIPVTKNDNIPNLGSFFLKHLITMDTPVEKIYRYCKELKELEINSGALPFTLFCALNDNKAEVAFKLMEAMKEEHMPVKPHYFWPLLIPHLKNNNTAGTVQVLKAMKELGVTSDKETLSTYILPAFPTFKAARQVFEEFGTLKQEVLFSLDIQKTASHSLAELYTSMSDPSFPALNLGLFRNSLIKGFKMSDDVESMVKITELLYKDERFSNSKNTPAVTAMFFIYDLIDKMTKHELQAQEGKLQKYFNQLKTQNITISHSIFRGIKTCLDSLNVPQLNKHVFDLTNGEDQLQDSNQVPDDAENSITTKQLLANMKENKALKSSITQVIRDLCDKQGLQSALEMKQQHEDKMRPGSYAVLINLCCLQDNVEEALSLKREMSSKHSSVVLDSRKYLELIRALSKAGKVDEAVDMLKEMKDNNVILNTNGTGFLNMMSSVAVDCGVDTVRRLQETMFSLGLATPNTISCAPVVTAYLDRKDLSGALEAVMDYQKRYKIMPRIHDIIVGLVESGDAEFLQKGIDLLSQERGEMIMLYDLFFAFLYTGRYREARKIIETPGMRAKPSRLHWFAERCIFNNKMETLEQLVEMTGMLYECDRDEMYHYMLRICKNTDNWQKAEEVWMKMQEENVVPRERTLRLLADLLKNKGQNVQVVLPETWYEDHVEQKPNKYLHVQLMKLCKKGNDKEAFVMLKSAHENGVTLNNTTYDHVIRTLFSKGNAADAMQVKDMAVAAQPDFKLNAITSSLYITTQAKNNQTKEAFDQLKAMLQNNQVPLHLALTSLVQAQAEQGDFAGIEEVRSLMTGFIKTLHMSPMIFSNNIALAHIKNGNVDKAVEHFEEIYTQPEGKKCSMSYVFRKVLEDGNEAALDKLSAMAERFANHFNCYKPALDLFLQLLNMDKMEEAKLMLERCQGLAEMKTELLSYVRNLSRKPGQVERIKTLTSLIPDIDGSALHSYLMKCHSLDNDLPAAKALYEQMKQKGEVDELNLKRLAVLYRDAGETVPFTEPSKSFRYYAENLKKKLTKGAEAEE